LAGAGTYPRARAPHKRGENRQGVFGCL
jgi:hypothetical protein